jgi:peptidoglycan hydrolase-like protein with peptidoglycan-binding domain
VNRVRGVLAATTLALLASAGGAGAHTTDLFGGWAKNDLLCTAARCTSTTTKSGVAIIDEGNQVGFWQNILNSDGFASVCTADGIDGQYGSHSESNTIAWQDAFALADVDGIVGPETWGYAQTFEIHDGIDGTTVYRHYNGAIRDFQIVYPLTQSFSLYWQPPSVLIADGYPGSGHPGISFRTC